MLWTLFLSLRNREHDLISRQDNSRLSHHEYTECRAAECPVNQSEYWSEDANYKNRTLTLALLRNWVSSASF